MISIEAMLLAFEKLIISLTLIAINPVASASAITQSVCITETNKLSLDILLEVKGLIIWLIS
tara:strand:+ start:61 stop:246 length:186 start_codon:yes stop_codon:yes gene_type:complete